MKSHRTEVVDRRYPIFEENADDGEMMYFYYMIIKFIKYLSVEVLIDFRIGQIQCTSII